MERFGSIKKRLIKSLSGISSRLRFSPSVATGLAGLMLIVAIFALTAGHSAVVPKIVVVPFTKGLHLATSGQCKGLMEPNNPVLHGLCTHGYDVFPLRTKAASPTVPVIGRSVSDGGNPSPSAAIPCVGDGVSGNRIRVIYAHAADKPDRFEQLGGHKAFQDLVGKIEYEFENSVDGGQPRRVRWVTDPDASSPSGCRLTVDNFTLPAGFDVDVDHVLFSLCGGRSELDCLSGQGTGPHHCNCRKYLVYVDDGVVSKPGGGSQSITGPCAVSLGGNQDDDQPGRKNFNNNHVGFATFWTDCWNMTESHELVHTLGAVQKTAPNSSGNGHCIDKYDNLCRGETKTKNGEYDTAATDWEPGVFGANGKPVLEICSVKERKWLYDCNHDDYYNTKRQTSGWLKKHWNVANSSFLVGNPKPKQGPKKRPSSATKYSEEPPTKKMVGIASTPDGSGYWVAGDDGGVFTFGDANFFGSMGGQHLNAPVVGIVPTSTGDGYWLVAADGGVFSFGDAQFYGSCPGIASGCQTLNQPVVGMTPTATNAGYWLAAADGGVFAFGDAANYNNGAEVGKVPNSIVGITAVPSGCGYWLVGKDGGVFTHGCAGFYGSMANTRLNSPVVGIAAHPNGCGYWLAAADGGVFVPVSPPGTAANCAAYQGNTLGTGANLTGLIAPPDGGGYWLIDSNGKVSHFGSASDQGGASVSTTTAAWDADCIGTVSDVVVAPGQQFSATMTPYNAGTTTWDTTYRLASVNNSGAQTATWGTSSLPVSTPMATGDAADFSATFTAPNTVGTYDFNWQIMQGDTKIGGPCTYSVRVVETVPPTAPTFLHKVSSTANSVFMSWAASTDNVGVTGYNVYKEGVKIASLTNPPTTNYTATGLTGPSYNFYVTAFDASGNESPPSNQLSFGLVPPLGQKLSYIGNGYVDLTWNVPQDRSTIDHYLIYLNGVATSSCSFGALQPCGRDQTGFRFGKLEVGTYSIQMSSVDSAGQESVKSAAVSTTLTDVSVNPPTNLRTTEVRDNSVTLAWDAVSDPSGIDYYRVIRWDDSGSGNGEVFIVKSGTSYIDTTVKAQTQYRYFVDVKDNVGNTAGQSGGVPVKTKTICVLTACL